MLNHQINIPYLQAVNVKKLLNILSSTRMRKHNSYISAPTITVHTNRLDAAVNDLVFLTTWQTGQDGPYLFDLQGVGWKKANARIS